MNDENEWLHTLPVNSHGCHMLTLKEARQLALLSPTPWYVGPYRCGYAIGKHTVYPEWDLYYIVDEHNEPLRFDDIDAAIHFLRTQLHVHEACVLLNAAFASSS